jgi:hypothetical protein
MQGRTTKEGGGGQVDSDLLQPHLVPQEPRARHLEHIQLMDGVRHRAVRTTGSGHSCGVYLPGHGHTTATLLAATSCGLGQGGAPHRNGGRDRDAACMCEHGW